MNDHENELPMLAGIAALIHWCEELLNILNGPLLLLGAGIALVDLLTDGALTVSAPILLYAWAISQALGIDTQLLGCFARARSAHAWARVGWLVLGVILGFAAWQAGDVFAVQQAQHLSEATALARLGVDPAVWLGWRAFLAVGLVALSGWTRYRRPAPVALADEREKLERELALEPLRQRLRMQQVGGFRSLAQTALQGAGVAQNALPLSAHFEASQDSQSPHTATQEGQQAALPDGAERLPIPTQPHQPPTGPGSPSVASKPATRQTAAAANVTPLRAPRPARQSRRVAARANARSGKRGTAEKRIRALLAADPTIEFAALVKQAKVSASTASKWLAVVEAERSSAEQQQRQESGYAQ